MSLLQEMMSEKQWQESVVAEAWSLGADQVYHTHDSRHSPAGFPDLIILMGRRMIVVELKKVGGVLSAEQYFCLIAFIKVGAEVYLWDPRDGDEVTRVLQNKLKWEVPDVQV